MRYRTLQPDGDYTFGQQNEYLTNSAASVAQAVLTGLLLHQGEQFNNLDVGMPWETQVLGYGTKSLYDAAIKNQILQTQGVLAIISYSSTINPAKRSLFVSATMKTIFGPVDFNKLFGGLGGYGISPFGGSTSFGGV